MDESVKENIETIELPSDTLIYKEITVSITMSKSVCLEIPENATSEQIQEFAKQEIITPDKIMKISEQVINQLRLKISGLDFKGWNVDELEYIIE